MRRSPESSAISRLLTKRRVLDAAVVLFAICWTLWPFLVHRGIPVFEHDWSWPFQNRQGCDAIATFGSTWLPEGLGHANPFANDNPVNHVILRAGCLLPEDLALRLFLFGCAIAAAAGAISFTRGIAGGLWAARAAAFLYVASPPFFNKVSAGHIAFWAAYALFPWVGLAVARLLNTGTFVLWCVTAIAFALSFVQPQFYVLTALLALAVCAACAPSWKRVALVGGAYGLALVLSAPSLFAMLHLQRAFSYTIPPPQLGWESFQSGDFFEAYRMLGYISHYADDAYHVAFAAPLEVTVLGLLCAIAATGFFVASRRIGYTFATLCLVGIFVLMGVRGPLAPVLVWGYENVPATALFRELYHAVPVVALAYSVGLALFLGRFRNRGVTAAVFACLVVSLLPLAVPGHALDLTFRSMPEDTARAIERTASFAPGRVLPLPYRMPIAFDDSRRSGVDVLSYVDSMHRSIGEYAPTPELDGIFALLRDGKVSEAKRHLASFGVSSVLWRPELRAAVAEQFFGVDRASANLARKTFDQDARVFRQLTGRTSCAGADCAAELSQAHHLVEVAEPGLTLDNGAVPAVRLGASHVATSPLEGWVTLNTWNWLDSSWSGIGDVLAITERPDMLAIDGFPGTILRYDGTPGARICALRCVALRPGNFALNASHQTLIVRGPAILSGNPAAIAPSRIKKSTLAFGTWVTPTLYKATIRAHGTAGFVARTRFDQGWRLDVGGRKTRHVRADRYANAWIFALDGASQVFLYYSPQRTFARLVLLERVLYGILVFFLLIAFVVRVGRRGVASCQPQ